MFTMEELAVRLQGVPQFRELPLEVVLSIVKSGDMQHFRKDEYIFHEGDPCAGMYVLVQGQVSLCKTGPEGQISLLNVLSPVIMFNEVAVLDGEVNPVTSIATTDVTAWRITRNAFQEMMLRIPQIGISLLQVLARRNRLLIAHYDDLSFRSIEARMAKYLVELSKQGKVTIFRKNYPIKAIAARVVTTPEAVSRTLKDFRINNLITCDRTEITITNLAKLVALAQIEF